MSAPSRASIPSPMRRVFRSRKPARGHDFFEDDSAEAMFGDKLPSGKEVGVSCSLSCLHSAGCQPARTGHSWAPVQAFGRPRAEWAVLLWSETPCCLPTAHWRVPLASRRCFQAAGLLLLWVLLALLGAPSLVLCQIARSQAPGGIHGDRHI
jgi:hypothetical protein